jgi:hypothetical protein
MAARSCQRSEKKILGQATRQLLATAKRVANVRGKSICDASLRRKGYSERFIEKLRRA